MLVKLSRSEPRRSASRRPARVSRSGLRLPGPVALEMLKPIPISSDKHTRHILYVYVCIYLYSCLSKLIEAVHIFPYIPSARDFSDHSFSILPKESISRNPKRH